MKLPRLSGILLHPTSFRGPDGIGDFGPEAYAWVDFLHASKTHLWQMLPLGPTGYGDSPYQSFSAFAGNPYLISPALLPEDDYLSVSDLEKRPQLPEDQVDYGAAIQWKKEILATAFQHFLKSKRKESFNEFNAFVESQRHWLDHYSLFMAIKDSQNQHCWLTWPDPLKLRDPKTLESFRQSHQNEIMACQFQQMLFYRQWQRLKSYANALQVSIIGDVPIFISMDSSDAWANKELFSIDERGKPAFVAGVPPDYFSPTGQYWGNPLYCWEKHAALNYSWWIQRMKSSFALFDWVRLDHFRGFSAYWKIPYGSPSAETGFWEKAPGHSFFTALKAEFGELPIIAEDLGVITPDVEQLRDQFDFPGMRVMQFAFNNDATDQFLPHNYVNNTVAYTGTHDNDTSRGWYETANPQEKAFCQKYVNTEDETTIPWNMIRAIWGSVAAFAIAPMQDFLNLDGKSRMNFPSRPCGNWNWRLPPGWNTPELQEKLTELNTIFLR